MILKPMTFDAVLLLGTTYCPVFTNKTLEDSVLSIPLESGRIF